MPETTGFGDDDIKSGGNVDNFWAKQDKTYRLALCLLRRDEDGNYDLRENADPRLYKEYVHWIEDYDGGTYVVSNPYLEEKLGSPKPRVGTVVVQYNTDASGKFPTGEDGKPDINPDLWQVKPWVFGRDKYKQLDSLNDEWPMVYHDFRVTCEKEDFQTLDITPCKGEAVWRRDEEVRDHFLQRAEEVADEIWFGQDPDIEQMKAHFNDDGVKSPDVSESVDQYDDLLNDIE